jgi:hypothetical protein
MCVQPIAMAYPVRSSRLLIYRPRPEIGGVYVIVLQIHTTIAEVSTL